MRYNKYCIILNIKRNLIESINFQTLSSRYNDLTRQFPCKCSFRRLMISLSHNHAASLISCGNRFTPACVIYSRANNASSGWVFNMQFRKVPHGLWIFCTGRKLRAYTHTHDAVFFLSFFFFLGAGVRDNRRICAVS